MSNYKPILFSTEMVKAILDGRKTQTRRIIKLPRWSTGNYKGIEISRHGIPECICDSTGCFAEISSPYQVGDILWVRETWYYEEHMHDLTVGEPDLPSGRYAHRYVYRASQPDYPVDIGVGEHGWHPSIHMPREAARIFLRVKDVRVERLQDITEEDCYKEGVGRGAYVLSPEKKHGAFNNLWNSTIKKADLDRYGWEVNPFCWVIEFERAEV